MTYECVVYVWLYVTTKSVNRNTKFKLLHVCYPQELVGVYFALAFLVMKSAVQPLKSVVKNSCGLFLFGYKNLFLFSSVHWLNLSIFCSFLVHTFFFCCRETICCCCRVTLIHFSPSLKKSSSPKKVPLTNVLKIFLLKPFCWREGWSQRLKTLFVKDDSLVKNVFCLPKKPCLSRNVSL